MGTGWGARASRFKLGMNIPPTGKGKENMGNCVGRFMEQVENRGTVFLFTFYWPEFSQVGPHRCKGSKKI